MGDFGFDPSLILQAQNAFPQGIGQGAKNLSDIVGAGSALYAQNRQRQLADIVSQNAGGFSDPMAHAAAQGGFLDQAYAAQNAAVERQMQAAKIMAMHGEILRSQARMVKTPSQAEKFLGSVSPDLASLHGIDTEAKGQDALDQVNNLVATGVPIGTATSEIKEVAPGATVYAHNKITDNIRQIGGSGDSILLPRPVLETAARAYERSGAKIVPDLGRDPGGLNHDAFLKVHAEMYPKSNLAANAAVYEANKADLQEAQNLASTQEVKEAKALQDIQVLRGTMQKLVNTKSPLLNMVGRTIQEKAGDPNYRAFATARETALPAINAVINSGQMSVGAREEVQDLLKKDDSIKSMDAALGIIEQDMSRNRGATTQRVANARTRLATGASSSSSEDNGKAKSTTQAVPDHDAAAKLLRDPSSKKDPNYARALEAYKRTHGGREP